MRSKITTHLPFSLQFSSKTVLYLSFLHVCVTMYSYRANIHILLWLSSANMSKGAAGLKRTPQPKLLWQSNINEKNLAHVTVLGRCVTLSSCNVALAIWADSGSFPFPFASCIFHFPWVAQVYSHFWFQNDSEALWRWSSYLSFQPVRKKLCLQCDGDHSLQTTLPLALLCSDLRHSSGCSIVVF